MAEQHRPEVGIGVHPIAVRMLRIVVHPLGIPIDDLFQDPHDVGVQRLLRLVDEQRTRGMHRPQARDALPYARLPDPLHDDVGDVDQLDSVLCLHQQRFRMHDQGSGHRRRLHRGVTKGHTRAPGHVAPRGQNCTPQGRFLRYFNKPLYRRGSGAEGRSTRLEAFRDCYTSL